jgi:anti-sigma factor RsiW
MHKEIDLDFELHAYVDGDLDEQAMARVEDYLARNPETAAKVRAYLRQKDDLRKFARTEVPDQEPPALRALARKLARRLKPGNIFPWRLAVAMALVFAAGWLGHVAYTPLIDGPAYTNEVLQAHLLTSSDPAEILPMSPERTKKLFSRIDEMERLPNLRQFGFEPIGAQLIPTDEGMVLHVPYRDASGVVISWFLMHDTDEAEIRRRIMRKQGVSLVSWQHDHSRYVIAAALADDQLSKLAEYVDFSTDTF